MVIVRNIDVHANDIAQWWIQGKGVRLSVNLVHLAVFVIIFIVTEFDFFGLRARPRSLSTLLYLRLALGVGICCIVGFIHHTVDFVPLDGQFDRIRLLLILWCQPDVFCLSLSFDKLVLQPPVV
jgi:hypothetical protein